MPLPPDCSFTSEDYWYLPEGRKAELIDGQFYDMAPPNRIILILMEKAVRFILPPLPSIWTQRTKTG